MRDGPIAEPIDWIEPEALFLGGPARSAHGFWLDAGPHAGDGWSWMGRGLPAASLPYGLVLAAPTAEQDVPGGFAGGWVGWAGYDAAAERAGAPAAADPATPADAALRVRRLIAFDHGARRAWLIAPASESAQARAEVHRWTVSAGRVPLPLPAAAAATPAAASARHTPAAYAALIERCRDAIRRGDAYQLCLTTRFALEAVTAPADPVGTYLRLRGGLGSHHGGYLRIGEHALLSASPEQFLQVAGGVVRSRPIKGTRPRGATAHEDAALAAALRESPKERAENVMIVDLMRNDLQRVCAPGTVSVERLLEVESYPAVHQLVSTIAGRLRDRTTLGDLLAAAFPAGSMTGAPKLSAMSLLHGLEDGPRGVYAGCFGWVGHGGRADLAMVIRSVIVGPAGAYVGAGGGITWLSDPVAEVAEVALKARGPLAALGAALPAEWSAADSGALGGLAGQGAEDEVG